MKPALRWLMLLFTLTLPARAALDVLVLDSAKPGPTLIVLAFEGTQVGRARLSYEKLYDNLVDHLLQSRSLVTLDEFDPDFRHIKRDKRKRKSPIESGILALI